MPTLLQRVGQRHCHGLLHIAHPHQAAMMRKRQRGPITVPE
ncbi:hypothetical protein [Acidovorax sp. 62]|nr:hypothetical protein [Acidovorax sp. 62]